MIKSSYPLFLANRPATTAGGLSVTNKFTGQVVSQVSRADRAVIEAAISAAAGARDACRRMPAFQRAAVLRHLAERLRQRADEFAHILAVEAGKPIKDARGEVGRAIETFGLAAEEATRIRGEYLPLDSSQRARGYEAIWKRVPVGVCAFISPFNFPLNLVAHKLAPAIAVGCPWVLKPASRTPISALSLGEILAETDLPAGAFSILPCGRRDADPIIDDDRIKLISFTGSPEVGWALKARSGKKKVVLELGGNAGCIVDRDVNAEETVRRLVFGAFYQSGQSCISVQRVFLHAEIYETFKSQLIAAAEKLRWGDPLLEQTFLGPLISDEAACRVETWVNEALARGARLLCGGRRHGVCYEATLLENVPDDCPVSCREVFGPLAILEPFSDFASACRRLNASPYGLQAGVFTNKLDAVLHAFDELEVGGVIINDVPTFRADSMPYGGVKDSGMGREGVRFAIEELSELRLLVLRRLPPGDR